MLLMGNVYRYGEILHVNVWFIADQLSFSHLGRCLLWCVQF